MRCCQFWSPSETVEYCLRNMSESMQAATVSETSFCVGQMSRRKTGLPVLVRAERVGVEVVVDVAGERVGDDQRRAHQVVGADLGRDAAFEVAIAGEHGDGDQAVVFDGLRDVGGQRAGVADAGGAAVADDLEAELVEVLHAGRP